MTDKITTALALLRTLQKIDAEFPIQYAICLMEIARNEGLSLTALADKTGLALSTVSRIAGALSEKRQMGKPFRLVQVRISQQERRRKELYLTPRGHVLMAALHDILAANKPTKSDQRLHA